MNKMYCVVLAVFSFAFCAPAMGMKNMKKDEMRKSALQMIKDRTEQNPELLRLIKEDFAKRDLPMEKTDSLWVSSKSLATIKRFFKKEPSLHPARVVLGDVPLLAALCIHHDGGALVGDFIEQIGYLLDQGADPNEKLIVTMDEEACAFASMLEMLAITTHASKEKKCKVATLLLRRGAKVIDPIAISLAREDAKSEKLAQLLEAAYEVPIKALSSFMKNNETDKDCLVTCELLTHE